MADRKQIQILGKLLSFTYFVTQVFGLWPYAIDKTTRRIRYNFFKLIYSAILPVIVMYIYYTFGVVNVVLAKSTSYNFIHSKTINLVTHYFSILIVVSYVLLYVGQHFKFEISKSAYLQCKEVLTIFSHRHVDLTPFFGHIFIKTIVFDTFGLLMLWYNFYRSSDILMTHPFLPIFLYMPILAVRLYENLFYGGVLAFDLLFKQLNKTLLEIVKTNAASEIKPANSRQFIGRYCQLSDELDELSQLHFKLSEAAKAFNAIFDIQLLLWISVQLAGLLTRCFYQYIGIVNLLNSDESSMLLIVWQNMITLIVTSSTWIEMWLTSYACDSLVNEVQTFTKATK